MNSEGFRETFLRSDREGPKKAKMAGREEAKAGTEGPHDQRSETGKVKAESSLETTGSLAPEYREEGIQDWEGLSKSERDLDFVNETMNRPDTEYHHEDRDGGARSHPNCERG